jgi:hypothetical protein
MKEAIQDYIENQSNFHNDLGQIYYGSISYNCDKDKFQPSAGGETGMRLSTNKTTPKAIALHYVPANKAGFQVRIFGFAECGTRTAMMFENEAIEGLKFDEDKITYTNALQQVITIKLKLNDPKLNLSELKGENDAAAFAQQIAYFKNPKNHVRKRVKEQTSHNTEDITKQLKAVPINALSKKEKHILGKNEGVKFKFKKTTKKTTSNDVAWGTEFQCKARLREARCTLAGLREARASRLEGLTEEEFKKQEIQLKAAITLYDRKLKACKKTRRRLLKSMML